MTARLPNDLHKDTVENIKKFFIYAVWGVLFFIFGCATTHELSFHPQEGEKSYMKAAFHMKTETYENNKLLETEAHHLSFGILSKIKKSEINGKIVLQKKVIEKKGDYSLRQLGFPELGEQIEFTLDARGQVLHVKNEEPGTIFYLPFFIFPKTKVAIGEKWQEEFQWNMLHHPFTVVTQVNSQFANIEKYKEIDCYKITFATTSKTLPQSDTVKFDNSSSGYYLWDSQKNHILYAETHFLDTLTLNTGKNIVTRSEFVLEEKPPQHDKEQKNSTH
ncbi:MAG: hypothetical protein HYW47_04510 [Deltaproteobacteria bacterium]|nr:hypothetical protein [Deltaproteobacteria bacterium]